MFSVTPVDLSGTYIFDPASIARPFIEYDTVPFSVVNVDQHDGETLIIRYQADHAGNVSEKEKRYNLKDRAFRCKSDRLIYSSEADYDGFCVVWGKQTTTTTIHKNADGALVFENKRRIRSCACAMGFPALRDTTHTGVVVMAATDTNASPTKQSWPKLNSTMPTR